jgi:hypothetical protein
MLATFHKKLFAVVTGAISMIAPVFVLTAEAASFQISPTPINTSVGRTFTISVDIDSDRTFNAGSATLKYDPTYLTAARANKDGSSFSIWAVEPAISATAGTITLEGGHTAPLSGRKKIISVSFTAKKEGATSITFDKASILAGDGSGSDINKTGAATPVTIVAGIANEPLPKSSSSESADTEPKGSGDLPESPIVSSLTHPKEDIYSGAKTAKFSWELPLDVSIVRVEVDQSSSTIPKQSYDPAIADKEFQNFKDGINYLHVRYKNGAGWGPTVHRKFMSDRVEPKEFTVTATVPEKESNVTLAFETTDELSGISHYEISMDGGQPRKISLAEIKEGKYPLLSVPNGSHSVKITAFDIGGNKRDAEAAFMVNAPIKEEKTTDEESGGTPWAMIIIAILFACIGIMIGIIWNERNTYRKDKFATKKEADEVRDRIASVFSALREETDEQINRLFQKPNPSSEDREVTRRIHEAMDLSEEILAKEAEDVRKMLMR